MTNIPSLPPVPDSPNRYSSQIKSADNETRKLFDSIINQARLAAYFNLGIHLIIFIIAVIVLIISLSMMFSGQSTSLDFKLQISLGGIIVSLLILLLILMRNPVRLIRQPLISITSLLFIYMNFNRQIRQADALFRLYVHTTKEIDVDQSSGIYQQMQLALEEAMDQVKNLFDEL